MIFYFKFEWKIPASQNVQEQIHLRIYTQNVCSFSFSFLCNSVSKRCVRGTLFNHQNFAQLMSKKTTWPTQLNCKKYIEMLNKNWVTKKQTKNLAALGGGKKKFTRMRSKKPQLCPTQTSMPPEYIMVRPLSDYHHVNWITLLSLEPRSSRSQHKPNEHSYA